MNEVQLAKVMGLFSLALGTLELLASRRIAAAVGVGGPGLIKAFGAREIGAGLMVLSKPDRATPLWSRVAGDALDVAVLTSGLGAGNRRRSGAVAALAVVLTATVLDVALASALGRRDQQAVQTARRTRVTAAHA